LLHFLLGTLRRGKIKISSKILAESVRAVWLYDCAARGRSHALLRCRGKIKISSKILAESARARFGFMIARRVNTFVRCGFALLRSRESCR